MRAPRLLALTLATTSLLLGTAPPSASAPVTTALPAASYGPQPVGDATATVETTPVLSSGDAADDPAIWVDRANPERSLVIGNDKGGALEVYDLAGTRIQRIAEGFFGNSDVRTDVATGRGPIDAVVTYRLGVRINRVDPATRRLVNATDGTGSIPVGFSGEGLCLYRSPRSGTLFAFANARSGRMAQIALGDADGDGLLEGTKVRDWDVGSEVEGCVVDDTSGVLYVSEEAVGIWRYDAEPDGSTAPAARTLVDSTVATGGHLLPDVEGLTIVRVGDGGYLLASSQAASSTANRYEVYERTGTNAHIRSFRVADGPRTDGCGRTDGIDAVATDLGPAFPHGLFVCQDNDNRQPAAGLQNFKFVPLERVVALDASGPIDPEPSPIAFVASASSNLNASSHQVTIPSTIRAGDGLLLTISSNTVATLSEPEGATGWRPLGTVAGSSSVTRTWRKVAVTGDAGRPVIVRAGATSKVSMVLLGYRGTSLDDPVAEVVHAGGHPPGTARTTPSAPVRVAGSWAVSYWTTKDSTTTALVPPGGVTPRATGSQSGGGRVSTLVADSAGPVTPGTYGGLTALASQSGGESSAWTIVLAPRITS